MFDLVDTTPSGELLKIVRAALVMRGLSFSRYCVARGLVRQNAAAAISGRWTGPKATQLVECTLDDLGMRGKC